MNSDLLELINRRQMLREHSLQLVARLAKTYDAHGVGDGRYRLGSNVSITQFTAVADAFIQGVLPGINESLRSAFTGLDFLQADDDCLYIAVPENVDWLKHVSVEGSNVVDVRQCRVVMGAEDHFDDPILTIRMRIAFPTQQ